MLIDSAHIIRHKGTTFNKAVSELSAKSRWCLSGTPIQNKLYDIGALFAFIRVYPFHSLAMFRRFISTPFYESEERRAVATRCLAVLIDSLCLRRTRDVLNLPKPQEKVCPVQFSAEELEQYEQSVKTMNRALRVRPGRSTSIDGFGMFIIQLQLRILCNHGTFQHRLAWQRRAWLEEKGRCRLLDWRYSLLDMQAVHADIDFQQHLPDVYQWLSTRPVHRVSSGTCSRIAIGTCGDQLPNVQRHGGP